MADGEGRLGQIVAHTQLDWPLQDNITTTAPNTPLQHANVHLGALTCAHAHTLRCPRSRLLLTRLLLQVQYGSRNAAPAVGSCKAGDWPFCLWEGEQGRACAREPLKGVVSRR